MVAVTSHRQMLRKLCFACRKDLASHVPPEDLISTSEPSSSFLQALLRQRELHPAPPLCAPKPMMPVSPFLVPVAAPTQAPTSNVQFGLLYALPQYVPFMPPFMLPAGTKLPPPVAPNATAHLPPHFQMPVSFFYFEF